MENFINIIAMLGSGVFCSAIVSLIIEKSNTKRDEEEKARQKEFVLSKLNSRLEIF